MVGHMADTLIKEKDQIYDVDGGAEVIGACGTNERRQLNTARAISSLKMRETANGTGLNDAYRPV